MVGLRKKTEIVIICFLCVHLYSIVWWIFHGYLREAGCLSTHIACFHRYMHTYLAFFSSFFFLYGESGVMSCILGRWKVNVQHASRTDDATSKAVPDFLKSTTCHCSPKLPSSSSNSQTFSSYADMVVNRFVDPDILLMAHHPLFWNTGIKKQLETEPSFCCFWLPHL